MVLSRSSRVSAYRTARQPLRLLLGVFLAGVLFVWRFPSWYVGPHPSTSRILAGSIGRGGRLDETYGCDRCLSSEERCRLWGSDNLDLSRAFDGTSRRTRRFLEKARSGQPIKMAVLGGSVSKGHGISGPTWHHQIFDWINQTFPHDDHNHDDGSVAARGSDYFKFCHSQHIDEDPDLVLLEFAINDFSMNQDMFENFETLLRSILEYPSKPAVIIVQSFKLDGVMTTGGDSQLPVAQFYDVPVISARTVFLPMIIQSPETLKDYFVYETYDGDGNVQERRDLIHPNQDGHTAISDFVVAYLEQQLCYLNSNRPRAPPTKLTYVPQKEHHELDMIPRLRLNRAYSPTHVEASTKPNCASMDAPKSPLQPIPELTHGFEKWTMPGHNGEKKFWRGTNVGDRIAFQVQLVDGVIDMYWLRSPRLDLGSADCWLDDDRENSVRIDGFWNEKSTVGHYQTMYRDSSIPQGNHILHCEILDWTTHPTNPNAHEVLLIGLFSV